MSPSLNIKISLENITQISRKKLETYAELLHLMKKNDGWLKLPKIVLDYYSGIGVSGWAELYFSKKRTEIFEENKNELFSTIQSIEEALGEGADIEKINSFINAMILQFLNDDEPLFSFENYNLKDIDTNKLTAEEIAEQRDFWIVFQYNFYNDLSIATHGEPIIDLVESFVTHFDDDAMTKAIQVDRSLTSYFQKRVNEESAKGNADFFDKLSYRLKNPPSRGENVHPLLWILFYLLKSFGPYCPYLTNKDLLKIHNDSVESYDNYYITDTDVVRKQRKKFNSM